MTGDDFPRQTDASLARGLARRTVRTLDELAARASSRLAGRYHPKGTLGARYRHARKSIELAEAELLICRMTHAEGRREQTHYLLWDVFTLEPGVRRLGAGTLSLSYKAGGIYDNPLGRVIVTEHCLQRVFQRLGTTDLGHAISEMETAVAFVWIKVVSDLETRGLAFETGTPHGLLIGETKHNAEVILKTFVDGARLRPEQVRYRALSGIVPVNVKLFSGAERLPAITYFDPA